MSGTTSVYGLPYLELDDAPDIAAATQDLAEATETALQNVAATGPARVRAGTVNVVITASSAGSATITFSPAFAATPVIVATVASGAGATTAAVVRVTASSASGATLTVTLGGTNTITVPVNWVAVG